MLSGFFDMKLFAGVDIFLTVRSQSLPLSYGCTLLTTYVFPIFATMMLFSILAYRTIALIAT